MITYSSWDLSQAVLEKKGLLLPAFQKISTDYVNIELHQWSALNADYLILFNQYVSHTATETETQRLQ